MAWPRGWKLWAEVAQPLEKTANDSDRSAVKGLRIIIRCRVVCAEWVNDLDMPKEYQEFEQHAVALPAKYIADTATSG